MIRAFVDCDIIIDLLTRREPHFTDSALIFQRAFEGKLTLLTSPLAIANVHYIIRKMKGEHSSRNAINKLLKVITITDMNQSTVFNALKSDMKDFEDALQSSSAATLPCDFIITRNIKDYKKSNLEAKKPIEALQLLGTPSL